MEATGPYLTHCLIACALCSYFSVWATALTSEPAIKRRSRDIKDSTILGEGGSREGHGEGEEGGLAADEDTGRRC